MDHIPQFNCTSSHVFEVPHLCRNANSYDGLGFEDFPSRANFRYQDLYNSDWQTLEESGPFLQAWLFFGILHEVFHSMNIDIELGSFVENRGDSQIITTSSLPSLMEKLITIKIPSHQPNYWDDEDRFSRAAWGRSSRIVPYPKTCLETACDVITRIVKQMDHLEQIGVIRFDGYLSPFQNVILSIIVLGETLEVYRATGKWQGRKPPLKWPLPSFLTNYLATKGWCHFEVHTLYHKYQVHGYQCYLLCTLASYDRRPLNYNHDNCTTISCNAYQVDNKTYNPIHTNGPQKPNDTALRNYQCSFQWCSDLKVASPNSTAVDSIINNDGTPLITVSSGLQNEVLLSCNKNRISPSPLEWGKRLSRKASSENMKSRTNWIPKGRYVAISHVWSDGRGNIDSNSLPACQLLNLQELVNQLYHKTEDNIPFWIDTICVPKEREVRKKAIAEMYKVYDEADKVLVLDASIMRCSKNCSLEQRILTISCSPWTSRLWTYQEGIFANDLYFQFADGPVSYASLKAEKFDIQRADAKNYYDNMQALSSPSDQRQHKIDKILDPYEWNKDDETTIRDVIYLRPILQIWPLQNLVGERKRYGKGLDLQQISWDLKDRSTSNPKDESICLAILTQQSLIKKVRELSKIDDGGMKEVIASLKEVNYEILCWKGQRYQEDGYRWIPTTLLTGFDSIPFLYARQNTSHPHSSPMRTYVTPTGKLSIKQDKPALGFLYLEANQKESLSPTSRMVLDATAEQNSYHEVIISVANQPASWQSFSNKRLAVMYFYTKPRTVIPLGLNYSRQREMQPAHPTDVRAILVSYQDDPIYFQPDARKSRASVPPYIWKKCGGDFRFEANVMRICPIDAPLPSDVVVKVRSYQSTESDCCLGGYSYPDRFKPPNWFIG